jgi:predicted RNA-binding Zn-ribbon protein involved in translation (DUF1610 family)
MTCVTCPKCADTNIRRTVKRHDATGTHVLIYSCPTCGTVLGAVPIHR